MSDIDHDAEFEKAFEGFGEDPAPTTPADPAKDDSVQEEAKKNEPTDGAKDDKKVEDGKAPETPETPSSPTDDKKPEEGTQPPKAPETPPTPDEPKPLTRDDVTSIINNIRTEERASGKELEITTNEVLEAYYPDGLSNVLVDQTTGKELRTPQDVVDATNGQMNTEQATQWLMNEQFKLDTEINRIRNDAQKVAETTINFKRDSIAALQKYEPLFKWQPSLQKKAFDLLMRQVKHDKDKGVILSAPDVMDLYDTYLEPYQQAYEFKHNQPATNPNPAPAPTPTPTADDRLDIGGDGGASDDSDDPNNFAQQVKKELAKGI